MGYETKREIRTFRDILMRVNAVKSVLMGKNILSGTHDSPNHLWDIETRKKIRTFLTYSGVISIDISSNGRQFTGCYDGTAKLWDINKVKRVQ